MSENFTHDKHINTVDLGVQETATGGTPANPNDTTTTNPNRRRNITRGLIGGGTGLAIIIGSIVGIEAANNNNTHPSKTIESSATATPGAESTEPVMVEIVAAPISAEKYTTPEAVVKASVSEVDEWINAGGTEANSKAQTNTDNSGKYFTELMATSNTQYESQLLIANWRDVSSLSAYVPNKEDIHKKTTSLNFLTTPNDPNSEYNAENKEAYKRGQVVDSIQIVSADSAKIIADITVHEYDNSDKNAVLKYTNGVAVDTAPYKIGMTWTNVDGNWKISDYSE